nr:hypothetical protein CFP56_01382 [Quercus suber]
MPYPHFPRSHDSILVSASTSNVPLYPPQSDTGVQALSPFLRSTLGHLQRLGHIDGSQVFPGAFDGADSLLVEPEQRSGEDGVVHTQLLDLQRDFVSLDGLHLLGELDVVMEEDLALAGGDVDRHRGREGVVLEADVWMRQREAALLARLVRHRAPLAELPSDVVGVEVRARVEGFRGQGADGRDPGRPKPGREREREAMRGGVLGQVASQGQGEVGAGTVAGENDLVRRDTRLDEDMGDVRVANEGLGRKPGVLGPAVSDHEGTSMEVQGNVSHRLARGRRVPGGTDRLGLDRRIDVDGSSVSRCAGRLNDHPSLALSARDERERRLHLDHGAVPQERLDDLDEDGLLVGPLGMLAHGRRQIVDEPEGEAGHVEGDGKQSPDTLQGLDREGSHGDGAGVAVVGVNE